jgi:hypothetical protein
VTTCELFDSPAVELYFYGELDPAERARVQAHLQACSDCRLRLNDLYAIRRALAERPRVDAPPADDWSGFMRRLDEACLIGTTAESAPVARRSRGALKPLIAVAATLVLVTISLLVTVRQRPSSRSAAVPDAAAASPTAAAAAAAPASDRAADRALAALSEQHFERSKLVVLGLAGRDPEHTTSKDWAYERDLAGSLLTDTRLYRLAAQDRGLSDIAHVMGDLETVLLEASMTDRADAAALERVQNLIRKRDLVVKMQVVGSTGI